MGKKIVLIREIRGCISVLTVQEIEGTPEAQRKHGDTQSFKEFSVTLCASSVHLCVISFLETDTESSISLKTL